MQGHVPPAGMSGVSGATVTCIAPVFDASFTDYNKEYHNQTFHLSPSNVSFVVVLALSVVPVCMFATLRFASSALGDNATTTPQQRYMEYMRIIFTNIAVVQSFVEEIDPAFVICSRLDLWGDAEHAARVAEFVSPSDVFAQKFAEFIVQAADGHTSVEEDLLFEGADKVAARFQRKLDIFEPRYCRI